jgi:ribosomal protein L29|tara:strand:- start:43 stop:288 length:246 start_codon:yes stop_codon:yes gene_type:complete
MPHNKFKQSLKEMDINQLNTEIQKRKELLLRWNSPTHKTVQIGGVDPITKLPKTYTQHPYNKIRKELTILNTIIHQRLTQR